ncbi:tetratricopeptide (TPR) repeat protein [Paenibacillus sp. DS2015]|uniref:FxLYD domain-containing protein n=1 Tax=Paenibacillus sp. DS2015 TaxID=3373917 RepID=UPI003D1AA9C4
MYCHICGAKSTPGTAFCTSCGTKLHTLEEQRAFQEAAARTEIEVGAAINVETESLSHSQLTTDPQTEVELEIHTETVTQTAATLQQSNNELLPPNNEETSVNTQVRKKSRIFVWLIPLLLLIAVGLALIFYSKYEAKINEQVQALHENAETEALAGRYKVAMELLDSAAAKRPSYQALGQDRSILVEAEELQVQLAEAVDELKTQKLKESGASMNKIAKILEKRDESLFASIKKELAENQVKLTVMTVKSELDQLDTVEELSEKLDSVAKLEGPEVAEVKTLIMNKLVEISYTVAEKMLKSKDYVGALQAVDKGLSFEEDNNKLSTYKERILNEKQAFEEAEEERVQLAEQEAAEEDLNNRTAAVYVTDLEVVLDEYGDLEISGTVSNTATRPINSVDLNIEIYDAAGSYIGETTATVYPYRLESGESGEFSATYYGVYEEEARVNVVDATWYLE